MKKKVIALLLCMTMVFGLTACGGSKDGAVESTEAIMPVVDLAKYDLNYADYVTLCDYSVIPVELSSDYEVTDTMVEEYMIDWFNQYGPFYVEDNTKTVIAEGDIVNVNYVGKLDGVAFDGGTAENQLIDVSGNCSAGANAVTYIDGFTSGLLGAEVGTEIDCNVTFPEEYGNEELNGKEVVFTFTINSIQKEINNYEEIDDSFAKQYAGTETLEEMYVYVREMLEVDANNYKTQEIDAGVQQYLLDNCVVEIPTEYFADLMKAYRNTMVWQYCEGDESELEGFLLENYNMTVEAAEEEWRQMLTEELQLEIIMGAIARELGVELSEEEYETRLADLMSYYGIKDEMEVFETYGYGDVVYGEARLKELYLQSNALDKLIEKVETTVAEPVEEVVETTETTNDSGENVKKD